MKPTPETDAFVRDHYSQPDPVDCLNLASRFELERDEARGQRDRLAEALRITADGTSCRECGGEDQALLAREALQSLTPNAKP